MAEDNKELKLRPQEWMLKPCEWYKEEYRDCKCMKARFNQYFIYGKYLDCSQWKVDYENCEKWKSSDDDEAFNALVTSEQEHRLQRLRPHYTNDVWTKRDGPPKDWNAPLPEWMQKEHEHTYLAYKQKSLEAGKPNDIDLKLPFCTIM